MWLVWKTRSAVRCRLRQKRGDRTVTILLGDVRAEEDTKMLKQAFVETDDYRTLIERNERCIVVGRRGTGKSALALKLAERQEGEGSAILITIAGDEEENIGIEEKIQKFGKSYGRQKAAAKLVWLYAIWMEILQQVRDRGNDGQKGRKIREGTCEQMGTRREKYRKKSRGGIAGNDGKRSSSRSRGAGSTTRRTEDRRGSRHNPGERR